MKPVILVIDILQDFFKEGRLKDDQDRLTASVNELVALGREHNVPIVWVRQEFKEDLSDASLGLKRTGNEITIEGTPGSQLLPELDYKESDSMIIKKRFSVFFGTKLEDLLKELDIDTLIIAGVNTHACVRMAAIDAYQRDYEVVLATDCVNSTNETFHNTTLEYLTRGIAVAMSNKEIKSKL